MLGASWHEGQVGLPISLCHLVLLISLSSRVFLDGLGGFFNHCVSSILLPNYFNVILEKLLVMS